MTILARAALADCEHALADFAASANTPFLRSRWVAVMTLLRTVGYALKTWTIRQRTPRHGSAWRAAWKKLKDSEPEPRIFWKFIDDERNDVVHLYKIGTGVNITGMLAQEPLGYFQMMADDDEGFGWNPTTHEFRIREGPFAGRDTLALCREAITFLRNYLDAIDE